ncbi:hypothetical protein KCP78_22630 [Salmonella enterica subsp. enterica]|nr:hypothetical protein KCP78_22630 [Salmonella enterica subsp. enterica]
MSDADTGRDEAALTCRAVFAPVVDKHAIFLFHRCDELFIVAAALTTRRDGSPL